MSDERSLAGRPLILGCGLAGLAISKALSDQHIAHVLIGDPADDRPRPGESLDLVASIAAPLLFPELMRFFHPKQRVVTHCGPGILDCELNVSERRGTRMLLRLLGFNAPAGLLHVDRIGFDRALYDLAAARPECRRIHGRVTSIEYASSSDRVTAVRVEGGDPIEPSYVFDAAGPARLVARAASLSFEAMGGSRRSVMAHLKTKHAGDPWLTQTTLLRLFQGDHGLSGAAWCIPLGERISVGLGAELEGTAELTDQALLKRGVQALKEVGVELDADQPLGLSAARFTYSRAARAFGRNWLLVGPSFGRFWWPLSAGVGSALTAAASACEIVRSPGRVEPLYQRFLDQVSLGHRRFDAMMRMERAPSSLDALRVHFDPVIRGNLVRMAIHAQIVDRTWTASGTARAVQEIIGRRQVGSVTCEVRSRRPLARSA